MTNAKKDKKTEETAVIPEPVAEVAEKTSEVKAEEPKAKTVTTAKAGKRSAKTIAGALQISVALARLWRRRIQPSQMRRFREACSNLSPR